MGWIMIIIAYVLGMGLFHVLGGLAAAADTLRRWGASATSTADSRVSSR